MTAEQAYLAMFHFLDRKFDAGVRELADILGPMSLLPDGTPADPAFAQDWAEAVGQAISGKVSARLELRP
mgnify:CR=1 FL=1